MTLGSWKCLECEASGIGYVSSGKHWYETGQGHQIVRGDDLRSKNAVGAISMLTHLFWYQCRSCKTMATSCVRYMDKQSICCNLCHSYMQFKWAEPITTKAQLALAERGVVWNPGSLADERPEESTMTSDGQGRR